MHKLKYLTELSIIDAGLFLCNKINSKFSSNNVESPTMKVLRKYNEQYNLKLNTIQLIKLGEKLDSMYYRAINPLKWVINIRNGNYKLLRKNIGDSEGFFITFYLYSKDTYQFEWYNHKWVF